MAEFSNIEERISQEFDTARKEYTAYDRTLDAVSALSFVLERVKQISDETVHRDFRPRLHHSKRSGEIYTPDGLIIQKSCDFVLELKTSWNDKDVAQSVKYGQSDQYYLAGGELRTFGKARCVLLGYQNTPGETNLNKLFDSWDSEEIGCQLVIFRYSLEQSADGDRMFFLRVPSRRNGQCPESGLGKAINSVRGLSVSVDNLKLYRTRFHKAGDQVIASYAAVLWWTKYAMHYLTDEQRVEMAERGRLSTPLIVTHERLENVPEMPGVEVQLGPRDVRRALEFLRQANLVVYRKRSKEYEIKMKEDRHIRLPKGSPNPASQWDMATKIIARWANHKVKNPITTLMKKPTRMKPMSRKRLDSGHPTLFDLK